MTQTFSKIWRRVVLPLGKEGERTISVTAAVEKKMADKVLAGTRIESRRQSGKCESPPTTPENPRKHEKGVGLASIQGMVAPVVFCLP